jgi:acyl-CoA reductase-like NAD-dependent aldehyde dehydrogenase
LTVATGSTAIVRADADLDRACPAVLWGAMALSGQTVRHCSRALVDASIVEPFTYHVARAAAELRAGDPADFATDVGPLHNASEVRAALERSLGADALRVGRVAEPPSPAYVTPVVVQAGADSRIAWDGLAGPVLAVIPVHGDAHAIEIANRPPARDAASVFTRDGTHAIAMARSLAARTVWINDHLPATRVGDGIVIEDDDASWDVRTRIAGGSPPALGDDPRYGLLGIARAFGLGET